MLELKGFSYPAFLSQGEPQHWSILYISHKEVRHSAGKKKHKSTDNVKEKKNHPNVKTRIYRAISVFQLHAGQGNANQSWRPCYQIHS